MGGGTGAVRMHPMMLSDVAGAIRHVQGGHTRGMVLIAV
jgi:hypothetical protein